MRTKLSRFSKFFSVSIIGRILLICAACCFTVLLSLFSPSGDCSHFSKLTYKAGALLSSSSHMDSPFSTIPILSPTPSCTSTALTSSELSLALFGNTASSATSPLGLFYSVYFFSRLLYSLDEGLTPCTFFICAANLSTQAEHPAKGKMNFL